MIAADDHDLRAGVGQPCERLVAQRNGLDAGERAIVDVAGDSHQADPLGSHDVDEVLEVGRLRIDEVDAMKGTAKVPVGGVQDAHGTNVRIASDILRYQRVALWLCRMRALGSGMSENPRSSVTAAMEQHPHHGIPSVHIADRRGITATGAVALAIAMGIVGGAIDVASGRGLRLVFAAFFVTGCASAAALIHREDLLAAVVIPPLAYLALALLAGTVRASGEGGSVARRQVSELYDALIISFPALFTATAVAASVALIRWVASRRRTQP